MNFILIIYSKETNRVGHWYIYETVKQWNKYWHIYESDKKMSPLAIKTLKMIIFEIMGLSAKFRQNNSYI